MTCALEDVGFEIRDCLMWLYGSGFPKSHDVGKAIDRHLGGERQVVGVSDALRGRKSDNKESFGQHIGNQPVNQYADGYPITEPATPEASKWQGWGTALKPAYEPIVLARKPLIGTVAENVLMHGTGGINVDGCRIEVEDRQEYDFNRRGFHERADLSSRPYEGGWKPGVVKVGEILGRWPSNLLLDEESAKMLDEQSGITKSEGGFPINLVDDRLHWKGSICSTTGGLHDEGGASRFFYIAKADRFEREAGLVGNIECSRCKKLVEEGKWPVHEGDHIYNDHPTVKPIELMRYLVRLVTPKGGICLDPFVGSGTTLIADMFEGVNGIGIEKDAEKEGVIFHRLEYWKPIAEKRKTEEAQERKEQSHRIAETLRTLDHFESDEIEQEQEQLGDGALKGDTKQD
jgi:site-specific DNA-methyltransferase (adenine-specific)